MLQWKSILVLPKRSVEWSFIGKCVNLFYLFNVLEDYVLILYVSNIKSCMILDLCFFLSWKVILKLSLILRLNILENGWINHFYKFLHLTLHSVSDKSWDNQLKMQKAKGDSICKFYVKPISF